MTVQTNRIADYITRRAFPGIAEPATSPDRRSFVEWSKHPFTKPFVAKIPVTKRLGVTTRVMPTIYPWRAIDLEIGTPHASITLNRCLIRFPEPFDQNGLTDACREFIIQAVRKAVEHDGRHRSITWPATSPNHHGEPA